jgi:hypothetical protein
MKTTILAVFALLGFAVNLWAESPPLPETGKVLLLDNDLIIEGDVVRVKDEYSVKRDGAGEVLIPENRVVKLTQSKAEAFEFLRKKVKATDPDARIKLARWGLIHQLHPEALEEAEAALKLRPDDVQGKALVNGLKQLIEKPIAVNQPDARGTVGDSEEVVMPTGFNANSFGPFTTKVQPLLMNLCASCHATGKGGNYKLVRVFEASSNRKGTLTNLAATLNQIARDKPGASSLLAKSVTAHGESAKSPIHDPNASSFAILEEWVTTALKRNEESVTADRGGGFAANKPVYVEPEETAKRPPSRPPLLGGNVLLKAEEENPSPSKPPPAKSNGTFGSESSPPRPVKKDKEAPPVKDEFDPSIFNQQTVPKK